MLKNKIKQIISDDKSYNKSSTRYLYKSHPDIWKEVLLVTSFLSDDAKPKQRIWHILNDVYSIPVCPMTGKNVKWWENRYLETSSVSAKTLLAHSKGKYKDIYTEEINKRRQDGNLKAVKNGRKYRTGSTELEKEKRYNTNLERYGNIHPTKTLEFRKYLSDIQIKNGATPRHLRSLRQLYYDEVKRITRNNWREHFDKINPLRKDRSVTDLDHIYSIQQGFLDNIPPYIIGHWTNLRMLSPSENYSKGMRCDKNQDQLFEDFFNS